MNDRIDEATRKPKQGKWREYFWVDLMQEANGVDLSVCLMEEIEIATNDAIKEALQQGAYVLNERGDGQKLKDQTEWEQMTVFKLNSELIERRSELRAKRFNLKDEKIKELESDISNIIEKLRLHNDIRYAIWGSDVPTEMETVNDLGAEPSEREEFYGKRYKRDSRIRADVKIRAAGRCEFCGTPGFERDDGTPYLECHHVIALADDGEDRMTNVIALCANDHRKAHFGAERKRINEMMLKRVTSVIERASKK